jgi:hypothetical protein
VYERHVNSPHVAVRKEIADSLHWLPESEVVRIQGLVARLLGDTSGEVREAIAFQFGNLSDMKQLRGLAQQCYENDPSEEVRQRALSGLCGFMDAQEAVRFCQQILANSPSRSMLWGVVGGLRHHRESPEAQQIFAQLASGSSDVAHAARDELAI